MTSDSQIDPSPIKQGQLSQRSSKPLQVHLKISSEKGLSSITTLIVGAQACVLIDPPFLLLDGKDVISFVKEKSNLPVTAVFVTHHHPDHYFGCDPILEAWPEASFCAAPYVRAGIDREYEEKCVFWPKIYGDLVANRPRRPDVYPYSFFVLPGNASSPVILLGPVQGDTVDHSMFYLPSEKTLITGDVMYGRSTHVWAEEIESKDVLSAWRHLIDLIEGLDLEVIIPGHLEQGWTLDRIKDLKHNKDYLDLFAKKIAYAEKQPTVKDIADTFKDAFPECTANLDFFLGKLSNQFGEGGEKWDENHHHNIGARKVADLEGFVMGLEADLKKQGAK